MNRVRAVIVIAALIIGGWVIVRPSPLALLDPGAYRPGTPVTVVTVNVCGVKCNDGDLGSVAALIADHAQHNDADVIGTQETCYDQAHEALELLGDRWRLVFAPSIRSTGCSSTRGIHEGYGNALFVRDAYLTDERLVWPLPNPADRQRRSIICTTALGLRGHILRLCNTHLDYTAVGNPTQAAYLTEILQDERSRHSTLIFTGDVNFPYSSEQERALAAVLPGEVDPTGPERKSVDRIKFAGGRQGSITRTEDDRTDHRVYATTIYLTD